jgi:hypothetical protein
MKSKNDILIYFKMSVKSILKHGNIFNIFSFIKYFPDWRKSMAPDQNPVAEKIPWITFSAIDFLKKIARPEMNIFEYGSGGSTFFWASRVANVISIEHDISWFGKIKDDLLAQQINNVKYILQEPVDDPGFSLKKPELPADYISSDSAYIGKNFEAYVKVIDEYGDEYFDIIVVDGRARPSCISHSLKKLKTGGYLMIDNSERQYYLSGFDFTGWKTQHFLGPVPKTYNFSRTTIFQKP